VEAVVFPRSPRVVLGWLLLLVVGLACLGAGVARPNLVVGGALLALAYVHLWVVWTGDAVELERHGLGAAVQLQLGLWLLSVGLVDALLFRKIRTGNASATQEGPR
jgi:hypothetical protein